jgi:hypothetical protein
MIRDLRAGVLLQRGRAEGRRSAGGAKRVAGGARQTAGEKGVMDEGCFVAWMMKAMWNGNGSCRNGKRIVARRKLLRSFFPHADAVTSHIYATVTSHRV